MSEKKEQKIVVFTTLTPADKNLILNGIKLASVFKKELCFAYLLTRSEKKNSEKIKHKLIEYTIPLKQEIPALKTSVLLLKENMREVPDILADDYEAILLIADTGQFKKFSKAVIESPVPFLFINTEVSPSDFKNIVLPVDLRKENSDSALWSSWFGRFNQSEIIAIAANEKNKDSQKQVARNVTLAKKLYLKFNVSHKVFKGSRTSLRNSFEALEFALAEKSDLLILLGSSVITPLDWLIGLPERKIIKNAGNIPVLLVNPRRDNYILCD
ncbi:MAG: hypothetical protein K0B11_18980 [Mariniphaga sp.]|nr:hypothetical protein [Mariniphaga sp.]